MTKIKAVWWLSTITQLVGVFALSSRLMDPVSCYMILFSGSVAGIIAAVWDFNYPLLWLNFGFSLSNILGMARW